MTDQDLTVIIRLLFAIFAGGAVGLERSFHGRPAGLRTHALVCASSSLLMLLTVFQWDLLSRAPLETIRVDPTRMAQGIMTGIGFLGAGVIMKDKFTIRGLTTATSIWMTASIGIVIGMGFYFAGTFATVLTIVMLSAFGEIERRMPTNTYSILTVRFKRHEVMSKDKLYRIIDEHKIKHSSPSYRLADEGRFMQYSMTIHTRNPENLEGLADAFSDQDEISEFSIIPVGR